jgi:FkbM family methyltransferase
MIFITALRNVLNHPLNRNKTVGTLARVVWWKVNQLFFHLPVKMKLTESVSLLCYPETSFGSYVVYATFPEYAEIMFVQRYLDKNSVFFDVGAHLGEYALIAASIATQGKVFAFEPTPHTIRLLEENIALNPTAKKIKVIKQAVSNKVGTAQFVIEPESEVNHLPHNQDTKQNTVKVKTTTLTAIASKYRCKKIDLVKIDVEGAELAVLEGAEKLLTKGAIKAFILEINPKANTYHHSQSELRRLLKKYRYSLFTFTEDGMLRKLGKNQLPNHTVNVVAAHATSVKSVLKSLIVR